MSSSKVKRRVRAGLSSQEVASVYIKSYADDLGFKYRVARKAGFGQKTTDLSFVIDGRVVNFEVKGAVNRNAKITVFDKSVRRASIPKEIQLLSEAFLKTLRYRGTSLQDLMSRGNYPLDFVGMVDFYHDEQDQTIGLAEDPWTASSGKLPRDFSTTSSAVCQAARKVILQGFVSGGDNYFVVHDKSTDDVDAWHTGLGSDLFRFGKFPTIKGVSLDTYGGASGTAKATRVGVKIQF